MQRFRERHTLDSGLLSWVFDIEKIYENTGGYDSDAESKRSVGSVCGGHYGETA